LSYLLLFEVWTQWNYSSHPPLPNCWQQHHKKTFPSEVLAKVTELLDWPYWQVRMQAVETLGELRRNIPDAAIRRLLALRRDPNPLMKSVREAADDALAEILSLEDGIEDD
jgi:HEAT repeat protein